MAEQEEPKEKKGLFARLRESLSRTRSGLSGVFTGYTKIDEDFYEGLEETMIMGDIGVKATDRLLGELREQVRKEHIREPEQCREILADNIAGQMKVDPQAYDFEKGPSVVLVIGVNGVGKTTSIGKLAGIYKAEGKKVPDRGRRIPSVPQPANSWRSGGRTVPAWDHDRRAKRDRIPPSVVFDGRAGSEGKKKQTSCSAIRAGTAA
jgi:hypothetical protein